MVKIIEGIREACEKQRHFFSFEFSAPTTEAATLTLYDRIERMSSLDPLFCSITWGDFGSTADASTEVAAISQSLLSINYQVNITGYTMSKSDAARWLSVLKEKGIQNILATRGNKIFMDNQRIEFQHAVDLVSFAREKFGDYFSIAVVGNPDPQNNDEEEDLRYLKEKVEEGADYIITQPIFSVDAYVDFRSRCSSAGISCPIVPSIMPVTHRRQIEAFGIAGCKGVTEFRERIEGAGPDESEVRRVCTHFFQELVRGILQSGCSGIYFYTLNAENMITSIIKGLNMSVHRALPWKRSENEERRRFETARPVHWSTQEKSYMARTTQWKDFKSGGVTLSTESPHPMEDGAGLHARLLLKTRAKRCAQFLSVRDLTDIPRALAVLSGIFVQYLDGSGAMPWAEGLSEETALVLGILKPLNARGLFTICSQPQVNGEPSSHKVFGWGPPHGYIYQKAYLEFFCSPATAQTVFTTLGRFPSLRFMAMHRDGAHLVKSNWKIKESPAGSVHQAFGRGVTAVTWGVFPGREVIQPTIVSLDTFRAWVTEAFELWAAPFALNEVPPVIRLIQEEWVLVCVVDNAYTESPSPLERAVSEICCKIPPLVNVDALPSTAFSPLNQN